MRELVRLATLAPSGHNTQPWKFRVAAGSIQLYPDLTRRIPVVDPDNRELWISLGGALENLLVAAEHFGYHPDVTYHLNGTATDHIAVALEKTAAGPGSRAGLFEAILTRQCTRHEYDRQPLPTRNLNQLTVAATGAGVTPLIFTGAAMEPLLEYVKAGNAHQMTDDKFKAELVHWIRFNDREALASMDGLISRGSGNPSLPRWVAQLFLGSSLSPQTQDKKDELYVRSSSGLALFTSEKNDPAAWVETGRAYERFALRATAMGVKNSFLNQPCEVPALRAQVQSHLSLNDAFPQLLVRFGHGPAMPRSLRRPVDQVLLAAAS
ncbi:MAG: Tat pathway signal protein [Hymenobacter sp.]|nr:Tat pathway signal protein [Hymenobacter sp.]